MTQSLSDKLHLAEASIDCPLTLVHADVVQINKLFEIAEKLSKACKSVCDDFQHNHDTGLRNRPSKSQCESMWFRTSEAHRAYTAWREDV